MLLFEKSNSKALSLAIGRIVKLRYIIFPFIIFFASLLINIFAFKNAPWPIDASHYVWMSRLILQGRLSLPVPELYEHFNEAFMVINNGHYYSLFMPAFSLFMAPFVYFGIEYFFNPLMMAGSIFIAGKLTDLFAESRTSALAMAFCAFSSFYILIGASYFSHPFNLFVTLLAVYIFLKYPDSLSMLALSSALIGILVFQRPQNAAMTFVPCLIMLAIKMIKKGEAERPVAPVIVFIIPFAAACVGIMFYNRHFTGHWLLFPQDVYNSVIEIREKCHNIGLGKGCEKNMGQFLPVEGLTIGYAYNVMMTRLSMMLYKLTAHPLMMLFVIPALIFSARKFTLFILIATAYFAGYFFFYIPGNFNGPRYFFEAGYFVLIIAAYGFMLTYGMIHRYFRPVMKAAALSSFMFLAVIIMPALISQQSNVALNSVTQTKNIIDSREIEHSLLFLHHPVIVGTTILNILNMQENPPYDKHGNLYLWDMGKINSAALDYYRTKGFTGAYTVSLNDQSGEVEVEPLKYEKQPLVIEAELKFRPLTGMPKYGFFVFQFEETKIFGFEPKSSITLSNYFGYGIKFGDISESSYYDFTHPFLEKGKYMATINLVRTPCGGDFIFNVNEKPVNIVSSFSGVEDKASFETEIDLKNGLNSFRFTPLTKDSCIVFDNISFEKEKDKTQKGTLVTQL